MSPLCCQTCNGSVVQGGTVITREVMGDMCGTVKTSVCRIRNRMVDKEMMNIGKCYTHILIVLRDISFRKHTRCVQRNNASCCY